MHVTNTILSDFAIAIPTPGKYYSPGTALDRLVSSYNSVRRYMITVAYIYL